jgi:hypothetical protein
MFCCVVWENNTLPFIFFDEVYQNELVCVAGRSPCFSVSGGTKHKGSVNDEVHGSEYYCRLRCDAVQSVTTTSGLLLCREVFVYSENY